MSEVQEKTAIEKIKRAFDAASFTQLMEARKESFSRLEKSGLPTTKTEEYKFTPVGRFLEKEFSLEQFSESIPSDFSELQAFAIPGFKENRIVFVNGKFNRTLSSTASILAVTLEEAIENHPELVLPYLDKFAPADDPFAQLNNAFWRDGLFIHAPKGKVTEEIISLHHIHDAQVREVTTNTRLLAVIEEGSKVMLVEKHDSIGAHPIFNNAVEEIVVKENASFDFCKIQNDKGNFHQVNNTVIHQSNHSRVNTHTFTTNGKLIRNNLQILVDGEGCESHFYGLYLLDNKTWADNHTVVDHRKPNSFSNELYKGIMDGNSRGVFNGKIYVRPHAQKTNAFQSNRNILLSDTATVNTKPQLEIWADDVKCSHGCTIGQLDEEALFYLQTRGIPKETAQAMLLYAFAGELIEPIKDERLRHYIDAVISERLHKNF